MKLKLIICTILVSALFITCKKDSPGINKAVVECYLIPGKPVSVKITKEISYGIDTVFQPIQNLNVTITNNSNSYTLTNSGNGIYTNSTIPVLTGEIYQLFFNYNNETVSAKTKIPSKPVNFKESDSVFRFPVFGPGGPPPSFPDPIKLNWDNSDNSYYLVVVTNNESNPVLIFNDTTGRKRPVFRTQPSQSNTTDLTFFQFSYFGMHSVVLCKIWPEYAALYEKNSTNSNNLSEPPTNIKNGRGIFTGVNTDTLYIRVY